MSDRLKQAQERFTEIKLDWGLRDSPEDVEARLAAVVGWLDSATADGAVPLRATQILLIDPEVPGATRRAVVKQVFKALGGSWLSSGAEALNLLQAMVLAARPNRGFRPFDLVGLMGAGWEVMVGRGLLREAAAPWLGFQPASVEVGGRAEFKVGMAWTTANLAGGISTSMNEERRNAAYAALHELRSNAQETWPYSQYSENLLSILSYVDGVLKHLSAHDKGLTGTLSSVAPDLKQLQDWGAGDYSYSDFSTELISYIDAAIQVLEALGADLPGLQIGWHVLRTSADREWTFDDLSPHLLAVLDALLYSLAQLQAQRKLATLATQLPATLASARPAELELLWWGQARYCHTYGRPFRNLLKAPNERTKALYAAIREAADRSWRLHPEPAAAYLVEVLSSFGYNVDENRPIAAWMRELAAHLSSDDAPQGPLATLAAEDAVGLPVTWARQHPRCTEDDDDAQIASALAIPVDAEIDLGTWATWILRERVLESRMRA